VNHPDEFFGILVIRISDGTLFQFNEAAVEPSEIIRRTNPQDPRENVGPTEYQFKPFS
jgi:hypothetical protein